jgi:hypothetical protein
MAIVTVTIVLTSARHAPPNTHLLTLRTTTISVFQR